MDNRNLDYRLNCKFMPGDGHKERNSWESVVYSDGWAGGVEQYLNVERLGKKRKQGADFRRKGMWEREQSKFRTMMDRLPRSTVDYFDDEQFIIPGAERLLLSSPSHHFSLSVSLFTIKAKLSEAAETVSPSHLEHLWRLWKFINKHHPYQLKLDRVKI